MPSQVSQITVLSPGLLGSSVARAVRARGMAKRIVVWAHRPERRKEISRQPWCDSVAETPEEAVKDATLVVLAAPVDFIVPLAAQIAPHLREGAIVTDVGSVKGPICRKAHAATGSNGYFVGSHPMAGSEKTSWEHGTPDFFEGKTCFVTPLEETAPAAVSAVAGFWKHLGMAVTVVNPDKHDEIVGMISHLPMVLASTLSLLMSRKDLAWRGYAGGGLRDTTRIAASDPRIWKPILELNRSVVLDSIKEFQNELKSLEVSIARGDWDKVVASLERAKAYRDGFKA
jgi:prephenate dehydrogenase